MWELREAGDQDELSDDCAVVVKDSIQQALAEAELRMRTIISSLNAEVVRTFQELRFSRGVSEAMVTTAPLLDATTHCNSASTAMQHTGSPGDVASITDVFSQRSRAPNAAKDEAPKMTCSLAPLVSSWPGNIRLREEFDATFLSKETLKDRSEWDLDVVLSGKQKSERRNRRRNPLDRLVLHPDSRLRWIFDAVSLIVLLIDAVFTPYSMTFSLDDYKLSIMGMTIIASFWFVDLFFNFVTGFNTSNGEIELRFCRVAMHYFRTAFVLDVTCVAVDMMSIVSAMSSSSGAGQGGLTRVLRIAKMQRFIRIFSVVRMFRVMKKLSDFMEAQVSQSWRMVVLVLQLTSLLMWICHVFACIWYSIGAWAPTGKVGLRWLDVPLHDEPGGFREQEDAYVYVASYHWSLAQITLGGTDITAVTAWERVFTMFCNLFGLIFGGALVSILSTTLIELRELNQEKNTKLSVLKEFLSENGVSLSVRLRVLQQVHDRVHTRDKVITEKDVQALNVVSRALVRELRFAVFSPHMLSHPLFLCWQTIHADVVKILCSNGLAFVNVRHEDEVFATAAESHHVLYLMDGSMSYVQNPKDRYVMEEKTFTVLPQSWMCEATWWCHWVHVGDAFGTSVSSILTVSPEAVMTALGRNATVQGVTLEYAKRFHEQVVQPAHDLRPTDLHVPCTAFKDLIGSASRETHTTLGLCGLEHYLQSSFVRKLEMKDNIKKLVDEIHSGTCIVLRTPDGLLRSVLLTCVEFTNERGEILLEVAELGSGGKWKPSARLPGAKRLAGETFSDTFERVFTTNLSCLREYVEKYDVYHTEEARDSENFGIGTIYSKSICVVKNTTAIEEMMKQLAVNITYGPRAAEPTIDLAPTLKAEMEDMSYQLSSIATVYKISGSNHTSIYAWLDRAMFNDLTKYEPIIKKWAASFTGWLSTEKAEFPEPGTESKETPEILIENVEVQRKRVRTVLTV